MVNTAKNEKRESNHYPSRISACDYNLVAKSGADKQFGGYRA